MIIVSLLGGLGNQMFQYAHGRALSNRLNTDLVLDLSSYGADKLRSYQLSYFPIHARIASEHDISRIIPQGNRRNRLMSQVTLFCQRRKPIITYKEKNFRFDLNTLEIKDNSRLYGYWQSEKYFLEIAHIIRKDFSFSETTSLENSTIIKKIKNSTSVSIHIRHGDYLLNPSTKAYHGICSKEYYNNAMNLIEQKINKPEYYVFSDDPKWAKLNIETSRPVTIIDWNNDTPHEDLRIMSCCQHHIIANSSFSWWGAWLGENEKQIVIAPDPWFDTKELDTKDLYQEHWIQIKK